MVCPQHGAAVLKGLSVCYRGTYSCELRTTVTAIYISCEYDLDVPCYIDTSYRIVSCYTGVSYRTCLQRRAELGESHG